ncbi:nitroreductase [Pseudomonas tolaasii]|uniref:nitroreductase family protein n=1 Tax=Pseudomonas tolaasii TaxID=29442 RepID=UPI0015A1848A|nr:nitroreductase [Pseudomonas tolaasii]NWC30199.1 nitroreductase [Pseudomonas tolaasii]
MGSLLLHTDTQHDGLQLLLSRQSHWPLGLPAPDAHTLNRAFEAAVCAPDHSQQQPWRFITIQDQALHALGEVFARAALKAKPLDSGKASRAQATAAPMIIAVGAHISSASKVPAIEQMLATAAAAMNLLNALHALGFAGYWATGPNAYDPDVRSALGLKGEADQLLGFIYVGTPTKERPAKRRQSPSEFVSQWSEPL